jgi:Ca2+-binding EF-hand superfamily protein
MKTKAIPALIFGLALPGAALAQMMLGDMDTDGNGSLSLAELQVVYKALDDAAFKAIDTNGDGAIDEAELKAAQDGGKLVAG